MSELIRAENICFSYTDKAFIENISFSLDEGKILTVTGENGCGKSTLLKLLTLALKADKGNIFFKGKNIRNMKDRQRAENIAVIYQNTYCGFPFKCFDVVCMGMFPHNGGNMKKEDIAFVRDIMEKTDTLMFADRKITQLSGGQLQRVLIAKALCQKPRLLFLDEALSGLDIAVKIKTDKMIRDIVHNTGMSVIAVRHDLDFAFMSGDYIMALKDGKMLYYDESRRLLKNEFFENVFSVKADINEKGQFFIRI